MAGFSRATCRPCRRRDPPKEPRAGWDSFRPIDSGPFSDFRPAEKRSGWPGGDDGHRDTRLLLLLRTSVTSNRRRLIEHQFVIGYVLPNCGKLVAPARIHDLLAKAVFGLFFRVSFLFFFSDVLVVFFKYEVPHCIANAYSKRARSAHVLVRNNNSINNSGSSRNEKFESAMPNLILEPVH